MGFGKVFGESWLTSRLLLTFKIVFDLLLLVTDFIDQRAELVAVLFDIIVVVALYLLEQAVNALLRASVRGLHSLHY